MNIFFLEFRDPLVSIIIFFALIFIITFLSYGWGRYKRREDYRHLDKFLKQFRAFPVKGELKESISSEELSQKSWILLASSYSKSGNYDKSIEIYTEILKHLNSKEQKEIMYLLGKTYFKAGFLERSKHIFLEILRKHPRTPQALETLLLVYEYLKDYKSALEVLEPLCELKTDISCNSLYLNALSLLNDEHISKEYKAEKLIEMYNESHQLSYLVFEYLFREFPALAWKHFDSTKAEILVDLLWRVKEDALDLAVIRKNTFLRDLYTARGDITLSTKSNVFEFDVLIHLKSAVSTTLVFEYICENCKQLYPLAFHRCSSCHAIDSIGVQYSLTKDFHRNFDEESDSFQ